MPHNPDEFNALAAARRWEVICDPLLAFEEPGLVSLYEAWGKLSANGRIPSRKELTPRFLKDWLPHVSFYERVEGEGGRRRYRIRLLGTAYAPIWGDVTGRLLDEAWPAEHLPMSEAVLDTVLNHGGPLRFLTHSVITGRTYLVAEFLSAALTDTNGEANVIMSAGYFAPGNWQEIARAYWHKRGAAPS